MVGSPVLKLKSSRSPDSVSPTLPMVFVERTLSAASPVEFIQELGRWLVGAVRYGTDRVSRSWNRNLTRARAAALGREFSEKGVNVLLGPVVGPLGRIPVGGRNWEGFSNDPYLAGALAYETVQGIQGEGVIASTKVRILAPELTFWKISNLLQHFIANEQETNRKPRKHIEAVSSNVGGRPLHELYAWSVQADPLNVHF